MVQMVNNLPAMQETQELNLGSPEDPLEKGMATHSSILAWRIPWIEEPGPSGCKESDTTERLTLCLSIQKRSWLNLFALYQLGAPFSPPEF